MRSPKYDSHTPEFRFFGYHEYRLPHLKLFWLSKKGPKQKQLLRDKGNTSSHIHTERPPAEGVSRGDSRPSVSSIWYLVKASQLLVIWKF